MAAPLCSDDDSNSHIFSCRFLTSNCEISDPNIKYEQIFSDNPIKLEIIANIIFTRLEKRSSYVTPSNMGPADPRKKKPASLGIKEARRGKINKNKTIAF